MHARLALLALALLAAGCAHRFPVRAGGDRDAVAGLPLSFGSPEEPAPAGTRVRWDFGDGSSAEGAVASHAWARAGEYRLTLEVTDEKGQRLDRAIVRVARRPPAAAVPPGARAALVLDRFFARLPHHVATAERLAGPDRVRALLAQLEGMLGFDGARPEQVLAAGVDPEEGLALAWLPDDAGTWVVVGIFDERAALEAARSAFARQVQVGFVAGPDGTTVAEVGQARILMGTRHGYLYLHLAADAATEARWDLVKAAPPEGLFADATFARLRAGVPGDDAFAFARGQELPQHKAISGEAAALRAHATALAAGLANRDGEVVLDARLLVDAEGEAILGRALAAPPRVELDALAPAGAVGYLSLSLGADALSGWIAGGDHRDLDRELEGAAGVDLGKLASMASGSAAVAAYFDLAALLRAIAGGGGPKVQLVAGLSLKDPQAARALLEAAAKDGKLIAKGDRYEIDGDAPAAAALANGAAWFGDRRLLDKALSGAPGPRRLSEAVRAALPADALAPGHQLLFLDVAGLVDQLRNPTAGDAADAPRNRQLGLLMSAMVDAAPELRPLLPVRDVFVDLFRDAPGSLALRARLRFR